LKVCYFGTYERAYPRNAQVISCLRSAGVEVQEEHVAVWEDVRDGWAAGPGRALRLAAAEARLLGRRPQADAFIVGYPGHLDLPAARLEVRRRQHGVNLHGPPTALRLFVAPNLPGHGPDRQTERRRMR